MKKKILLALFLCCLGGASLCAFFHAPEEEPTLTVQAEQTLPENAPKNLEELQNAKDEDIKKWAEELKSYNSCNYDLVTSVKNQGSTNICWAYGTVSTAETSILRKGIDPKATKETLNLDARNAAWAVANRDESTDPLKNALDVYSSNWNAGGGTTAIINVMSQGCIPTQEMTNHFQYGEVKYQLLNAYYIPNDVRAVKEAILRYGAVTVSYTVSNSGGYSGYYNYDGSRGGGHLCSIVGWDDNVPASSFSPKKAQNNGGWIVKNSWGNYYSEAASKYGYGYFIMSYENSGTGGIHALDFGMKEEYPNVYYYDGGSTYNVNLSNVKDCGAIYQVKRADLNTAEKLKGISLEVTGTVNCNVKIYTNLSKVDPSNIQVGSDGTNDPEQGNPAATVTARFAQKGTYTIPLDTPLDLDPGSYFSIVVETSGVGSVASGSDYSSNDLTFYKRDGVWYNYKYQNGSEYAKNGLAARIHAVTGTEEREQPLENDMRYVRVEFDQPIFKYSADGTTFEPKVTAYIGNTLLEETYYTLTYSDNHKPGAAAVTLTGKDGYQGEKTEHFLIQKGDLPPNAPDRTITVYNHIHYIKDIPLPDGWQWLNIYQTQTLPYGYAAVAEYKGEDAEYYLRTMIDIKIDYLADQAPDPIDLSDCEITVEGEYLYTGSPISPKPKVIVDGICLTEADYTVSYENNTHHGTATVTVTGRGAYYGTKSTTFEIKKAPYPPLEQTLIKVGEDVETLSEVPLPRNWAWKTNEKIGENGGEFTAVYKGADSDDYEICERTVVIERIRKQKPAQPEIPTKPDTPDQPDDPEPDTPSEPENPTEPDTPSEPENPSEPDTPAEPDTPTEPDDPVQPEIPTEPNVPKVPEPERPDPPAEPDDPTPPAEEPKEQPSEPDSPSEDRPSDSEASVKPDHSGSIDTPAAEESKQTNPLLWLLVIPAVLIPAAAVAIVVRKRK